MKIKKLSELNDLKKNIDFTKNIFVIDICEYYCFLCQDKDSALFFIKNNSNQLPNKDMFDYVEFNLISNKNYKTFLFNYDNDFKTNSFYLKSWFYVNGFNSLTINDNLIGNLESNILIDRAKMSTIFFNNYNEEIKNHSFSLINLCIPIYKKMTLLGLHVKEFNDQYYKNIKKHIDKDNIFHPTYSMVTSKSTRIGSNLHGFPKKFKHNIKAKKGNKIIEFDYTAAEARIILFLSNDKNLEKALKDDIHIFNAKLIFGDDIKIEEKHRELAKLIFFGWINGLNLNTISKNIDLDFSDTRILVNKLKKNYSKIVSWSNKVKKNVLKNKMLENVFGRKRNFSKEITQNIPKASRQIFSFLIQSTFTDIKLAVMLSLYKKFPNNIVGEITDSILMEFKDDENLEKNIELAKKIMEKPFNNKKLILPVKMKIRDTLGV